MPILPLPQLPLFSQGTVTMNFKDGTFAKGFVKNGILIGPIRHFENNGNLLNITDAITSKDSTLRKYHF